MQITVNTSIVSLNGLRQICRSSSEGVSKYKADFVPPCNENSNEVLLSKVTQNTMLLMCPLLCIQNEFLIPWLFCSKKKLFSFMVHHNIQ